MTRQASGSKPAKPACAAASRASCANACGIGGHGKPVCGSSGR
ncbi:Uncharacterised protein [Bordetella pertussis]|nr:Uncharacterised protein [Bordetella pertussis]